MCVLSPKQLSSWMVWTVLVNLFLHFFSLSAFLTTLELSAWSWWFWWDWKTVFHLFSCYVLSCWSVCKPACEWVCGDVVWKQLPYDKLAPVVVFYYSNVKIGFTGTGEQTGSSGPHRAGNMTQWEQTQLRPAGWAARASPPKTTGSQYK